MLAYEGGVQLVCTRLEHLVERHGAGDLNADDTEVESIMKQACDLVIIVLTGGMLKIIHTDIINSKVLLYVCYLSRLNCCTDVNEIWYRDTLILEERCYSLP